MWEIYSEEWHLSEKFTITGGNLQADSGCLHVYAYRKMTKFSQNVRLQPFVIVAKNILDFKDQISDVNGSSLTGFQGDPWFCTTDNLLYTSWGQKGPSAIFFFSC